MEFRFLTEPALFIEDGKILVIADLHLGIELEIARSGISIPSQIKKIQDKIDSLIKQTKAKHVIILGDVKHVLPTISWQEFKEIPEFFEHLSKKVKLTVVKGNHDGDIEKLVGKSNVKIFDPKGFRIKNIAFVHGQAWMDKNLLKAEYLLMAHIHPSVEFWSSGIRSSEHCWLRCPVSKEKIEKKYKTETNLKECIIMPVFNSVISGVAVNGDDFEPIGPLLRNNVVKWKESEIYLLDGTYLGNLKELKKYSKKG